MALQIWELGATDANYITDKRGWKVPAKDSPFVSIHDCAHGFIVCAETESEARSFAAEQCGGEREAVWFDPQWTFCRILTPNSPGIILRDYHAGYNL